MHTQTSCSVFENTGDSAVAYRDPQTVFYPHVFSRALTSLFTTAGETKLVCIARRKYTKSRPKADIYPEHVLTSPWAMRRGVPVQPLFRAIKKTLGGGAYLYFLYQLDGSESTFIEIDFVVKSISIQPLPFSPTYKKAKKYFVHGNNKEFTYVLKKIHGSWVCVTGPVAEVDASEEILAHYHDFEIYALSHACYFDNDKDSCVIVASISDNDVAWSTQADKEDCEK